ncbi:hypothetical protein PsorP6_017309 [Peronosclerospora sorghi]|uniref:Uncharacterized protein n=1 Tax=Peronosclerospora sorghi TaxID=230839 RepID=A0ACC0WKL8_9STRA|nr:hypothetical protein PsorP6_017309 [Peronosclerospora sorghi]
MTVKPTANGNFLVTPQLDKGKVCLPRGDDQLLHFQWVDRQTGASPEDFIIFPDDAHFAKWTPAAPTIVFTFCSTKIRRAVFFWMQNKDASRDEEMVKKVNDSMNNAQAVSRSDGGRGAGNNVQLDHNAIMQMLGAMGAGDQSSEAAELL